MVKLTMIARVTDGLPLAEGLDDGRDVPDSDFYKQQVKSLFKNLSRGQNEPSRMSIETGPYIFQYPFACLGRVCYLTMCDRSYPKKLSFQYLEDLKNEFERAYGNQIETAARPYAFIKFEVSQMSSRLTSESRIYADKAKDLNRQALIRKWAPVAVVLGVVFLLFWVRRSSGDAAAIGSGRVLSVLLTSLLFLGSQLYSIFRDQDLIKGPVGK
ncbi:UNVERIFIED_CONTAM: vesicle transport protein [Sesamum radiatum]|uniref:Vesicle transport protein n=1 Tax=Sesamum radiatum TaxID=300843 RepID=A0AAW2PHV4_SESRA